MSSRDKDLILTILAVQEWLRAARNREVETAWAIEQTLAMLDEAWQAVAWGHPQRELPRSFMR